MSKDVNYACKMINNDINLLSSEILRISKMSYRSWNNITKIRALDDQIQYLEELLAAYQRDLKKYE